MLDRLKELIDEQTLMVSVMLVNNETGVIQPIKETSKIAKKYGSYS
ncbi:aminotransferase class V-fold PLP-dependent enzyme [Flavivirga sp. 57AJ16]|nr:aminotransferase class V-fold PLP-dependent enzyme [Flavivirga sp. 57AJ16]MDD7884494.1 aminotransferase class V-fold PLP-dependent enzyme [Flavivirga sp. 57AJ16]